jgi:ankyrin repeat protein
MKKCKTLEEATQNNNLKEAKRLVTVSTLATINLAFAVAFFYHRLELVKLLVAHGADVYQDPDFDLQPKHFLNTEVAEFLSKQLVIDKLNSVL